MIPSFYHWHLFCILPRECTVKYTPCQEVILKELNLNIPSFIMIYCTVLHCTEMKYNATNCTVLNRAALHCHINTNITITFTFLNKFLLYLKNTKVWYYVLISFFMRKKNFCIYKTNSPQTNYNTYEIMILLNNVIYFILSI